MAIEQMALINIIGNLDELNETINICSELESLHIEDSNQETKNIKGFIPLNERNPYKDILNKIINIAQNLKVDLEYSNYDNLKGEENEIERYINNLISEYNIITTRINEIKISLSNHNQAVVQLRHLIKLETSFDEIFSSKYIKVRFGRMPLDSLPKISYYDNKTLLFMEFDQDEDYCWGVYFCPIKNYLEIDEIMKSLYFERIRVPGYATGTPQKAIDNITKMIDQEITELDRLTRQLEQLKESDEIKIKKIYSKVKKKADIFEHRKYASIINNQFYLTGFIPTKKYKLLKDNLSILESVNCVVKPEETENIYTPPVKLTNGRFSKPFENFVAMYGLPKYKGVDPTPLVAITYTLLFGIMFGDLGQGFIIFIIGLIINRWKKLEIGKVFSRIGISSMIFGVLYGSVFGIETLLDPLYKILFNLDSKPIHVFDPNTTNLILIASVFIGAILIILSIILNIAINFKSKNYKNSLYGPNGIAGLVLYVTSIVIGISILLFNVESIHILIILLFILIPIIVIFFRDPLSNLMTKRKSPKIKITEFITENFFELFEIILSYVTNTMSFLRVGGFILSHAGMMAVVITLSQIISGLGGVLALIVGNIFVIGIEGLIVGIQVLRLEFYEIFSRFFDGGGKKYSALKIEYKID